MKKTDHPCKGMTNAQVRTFERIAISQPPAAAKRTMDVLLARGLIERGDDRIIARTLLGPVTVPTYFVPLPVHMQWCQWCSENC